MFNISKVFFLSLFLLTACSKQDISDSTPRTFTQEVVDYPTLKKEITQENDTLYVVNFWATWCGPCVKELPHFVSINEKYQNKKFKMVFVSLDRAKDFETKVIPFAQEQNMTNADLLLLDDVKNMNTWIRDINTEWSGSIPATSFYKKGKQLHFTEGELSETELETLIKKNL